MSNISTLAQPGLTYVDALSTPYGLAGQLPPDLALRQQALNRRQQIANAMLQQATKMPQGQMAGQFYVPPSWTQNLAAVGEGAAGLYATIANDKAQRKIGDESQQMLADAVEQYKSQTRDVPAVPPSGPPPMDPRAQMASLLSQPPNQDNLPQGIPNSIQQGVGGFQTTHPMTGASIDPASRETPPIPPGQGMQPPQLSPQESVVNAMTPQTQGPVSPGTPARARTLEERQQALIDLMASQHPQAAALGKMLESLQTKQEDRADQQAFLTKKEALDREVRREGIASTAELRKSQIESNALNTQALIDSKERMGQDANALRKQLGDQQAELKRLEIDAKREVAQTGKTPPGYRATAEGNLEAIPGGPADMKKEAAFNQDTAILGQSTANMDRLATAANELLQHPGLGGITGLRGAFPNIPGSAAADAQAKLNTLKSQVGFGVLQDMRNNSKTGGALGQVSDAEGKRLEANLAALENAQSEPQMKESLKKIIEYSNSAKGRLRDTFNLKHPQGVPAQMSPAAPQGGLTADEQQELDRLKKKYGR